VGIDMKRPLQAFHHEMVLYRNDDEYLRAMLAFVAEARSDRAPVFAMVSGKRAEAMRDTLGADRERVRFLDMERAGRNPARIIPQWSELARLHERTPVFGIDEQVWPSRAADELEEAQRHEQLLNLALANAHGLRILCPYDAGGLDDEVIDRARAAHAACDGRRGSLGPGPPDYRHVAFGGRLPEPPSGAESFVVAPEHLRGLRRAVEHRAANLGLGAERVTGIVLAVDEVACNSIRHGGGSGTAWIWHRGPALVCEVSDRGRVTDPLAGRVRPDADQPGQRGLWLANQLCDLVQIRSNADGTTVRLVMGPD
jgi:anti-sigma regulatory factor (Ser/Thr protein kinase)